MGMSALKVVMDLMGCDAQIGMATLKGMLVVMFPHHL